MKVFMTFLAGLLCGGLAVAFLCLNQPPPRSLDRRAPPVALDDARFKIGAVTNGANDIPLLLQEEEKTATTEVAAPAVIAGAPVVSATPAPEMPTPEAVVAAVLEPEVAGPPVEADLLMPVSGIQPEQLTDTYTQSRSEGRSHEAIDIMAATGTPVVAVADGSIVKLFNSKQGGLTIYQFDIDRKVSYYYAHLDRYADGLTEGQSVKRGTLIGYVGFSGNANPAGPHLHFAIFVLGPEKNWWQGTPINPYPHLGGR